ncbi:MAG TPA: DedA family protein [Candidatus Baltobacteraceae bacterium]|nr:DedA family protein [Candidatus Baltobacteraceae bacterium]
MHAVSEFFRHLVEHFGYGGLFVVMTLANIGAPVGSEIVLPGAGVLVSKHLLSNVWIAIAVSVVAELCGQSIGYAVGRFGGRAFVHRYGKYIRFHDAELEKVHGFFGRYGNLAIFLCRFIPVIRGIVGIAAGIAEMDLLPFYLWTFAGSTIFCGAFIFAGYKLGANSAAFTHSFGKIALIAAAVVVVAVVAYALIRRKQQQRA